MGKVESTRFIWSLVMYPRDSILVHGDGLVGYMCMDQVPLRCNWQFMNRFCFNLSITVAYIKHSFSIMCLHGGISE